MTCFRTYLQNDPVRALADIGIALAAKDMPNVPISPRDEGDSGDLVSIELDTSRLFVSYWRGWLAEPLKPAVRPHRRRPHSQARRSMRNASCRACWPSHWSVHCVWAGHDAPQANAARPSHERHQRARRKARSKLVNSHSSRALLAGSSRAATPAASPLRSILLRAWPAAHAQEAIECADLVGEHQRLSAWLARPSRAAHGGIKSCSMRRC
jgi:hypothetical protein